MIVGRDNLKKLFPNCAEDVQENGIDLRIGELYEIDTVNSNQIIGCVDDEKFLPELKKVDLFDDDIYVLHPKKYYFVKVDRDIEIPHNYTQTYAIRSTFARCGLLLISSVGDDGFCGRLMMGLYNTNKITPICMGKNERIIQAITYQNDGTASQYDGSYQNNKIYSE